MRRRSVDRPLRRRGSRPVPLVPRLLAALVVAALLPLVVAITAGPATAADVTTYGGDALRTGWFADQTTLSPGLVSSGTFGQLWDSAVTGQVYAQPLVHQGTVFVATESNDIYGLDAATGAARWHRQVGTAWNPADVGCADLTPTIGVTGTPVIDAATSTAYFFAKTYASGTSGPARWQAHAVDVATGAERGGFPVTIAGTAANDAGRAFDPTKHLQRPGLLLLDGVVYAGFGGHCDAPDYRGWVVGVSTAGAVTTLWNDEAGQAGSPGAGIWQSGGGLVSDGPGQILLSTGNGNVPAAATPGSTPPGALGQAVVRLTVQPDKSLKATDFFMPYDAPSLNGWDGDLGSGAPVVLPSSSFGTAATPRLALEIGKQGYLYVLDANALGGYRQGPSSSDKIVQRLGPFGGVWSKPTPWGGDGGYVYLTTASGGGQAGGSSGNLRALRYGIDGAGKPTFSLAGTSSDAFGFSSGSPVVTSTGTTSGTALVWVVWSPGSSGANAQLRAYDPVPVNGVMQLRWSAPIGTASKFAVPAVSGNRVLVGTRDGHVRSFGSPVASPLAGGAVAFPPVPVGGSIVRTATLTANFDLDVTGVAAAGGPFAPGVPTPTLPARLLKGQTLAVPVTFTPTAVGLVAGALTVTTGSGPVTFALSGTGQSPAAQLAVDRDSLSLGGTPAGGPPVTGALTFTNVGSLPLTVTSVTAPAAPFSVTGLPAPGSTLAAGASVTATVTFGPTAVGLFTDDLTVASSGGTVDVGLSGTATTPPRLQLSTTVVDYGSVAVGATKTAGFTITNTGGGPLAITRSKPPVGGAFTATVDIPEGTTVAPGASVSGTVAFRPTTVGLVTGSWSLNGNDTSGAQTVTFSGTGVAPPPVDPPSAGGWQRNGSATMSGGTLVLTPAAADQAGSAYWPTPVPTTDLRVAFDALIDQGTGADGMAFVLADPAAGATATSLGVKGGGLGYSGTPGVAVTLDTWRNTSDPATNFIGLATGGSGDVLTLAAANASIPSLRGTARHVEVLVTGGEVVVRLDGTEVLRQAVAVPPSALVGFSAGTGGSYDRHAVSDVVVDRYQRGRLSVAPAIVDAGPVTVGNRVTRTFAVTNVGETPVTVTATTEPAAPFGPAASPPPGTVLAPGASAPASITFAPATLGPATASATFTGSDGTTAVASLTGIGQPVVWTPQFAGWVMSGSARKAWFDVLVTPAQANQRGSMYWPWWASSSYVDVSFDATLAAGSGGEGIGISLADAGVTQPSALGAGGGGLGWVGTTGFVATLDTRRQGTEPSANFVGFATASAGGLPSYLVTNAAVPSLRTTSHHVQLTATGSRAVLRLDGVVVLDAAVTLPPWVLIGVTGATSGRYDRQAIRNVKVTTQP